MAWPPVTHQDVTDKVNLKVEAVLIGGTFLFAPENTISTTFVDLTTVGPATTVTIGPSGRALVLLGAQFSNTALGALSVMGFAVSGASTVAATDDCAVMNTAAVANASYQFSHHQILTGLTAGSTTFTAKYRVGAGSGDFLRRRIAVIPL